MDISYLAGFIDGEGHIGIHKNGEGYGMSVRIGNTNLNVLQEIQKYFGGIINSSTLIKGKKQFYTISWFGENAINLLKQIKDKLIIKKELAEYASDFPIGEKGTVPLPMVKELRKMFYDIFKILNK